MVATAVSREQILSWLDEVADPEIPVLSITDLGIVRDVQIDERITVALTPTYSGCPATEVIEQSVVTALTERGLEKVEIERVLSPAWTTEWITDEGREKLREYGIAPPEKGGTKRELLFGTRQIACPRCAALDTQVVSEFGSTACKALWRCRSCREPFDYFKCI